MSPIIQPFMVRSGDQQFITESYVSVPPALTIVDETGAVWTLGFEDGRDGPKGEFSFNVLRNGLETGEWASRIERRNNRIRIFTGTGWQWMKSRRSDTPTTIYGIAVRLTPPGPEPPESFLVDVTVSFGGSRGPLLNIAFNSQAGGGVAEMGKASVQCRPGEWLSATVKPAHVKVEVTAYLGHKVLRAIPIVHTETLEERHVVA